MNKLLSRWAIVMALLPVLSACTLQDAKIRIGVLVLLPALLVIAVLWLLNRRSGEEKWDDEHFPDADDDDHEDHHLM